MNKFAETFVTLGLIKPEAVITYNETELNEFGRVESSQQAEILTGAEQIIMAGMESVHRAPYTAQEDQQSVV